MSVCRCSQQFMRRGAPTVASDVCMSCANFTDCTCVNGLLTGCYPYPHIDNATTLLPCRRIGTSETGQPLTACNPLPESQLNLLALSDPDRLVGGSFQCREGFEDRLCSKCLVGYYSTGADCKLCNLSLARWLLPLGFAVLVVVLVIYMLEVCCETILMSLFVCCLHFRFPPDVLSVFVCLLCRCIRLFVLLFADGRSLCRCPAVRLGSSRLRFISSKCSAVGAQCWWRAA